MAASGEGREGREGAVVGRPLQAAAGSETVVPATERTSWGDRTETRQLGLVRGNIQDIRRGWDQAGGRGDDC